MKTSLFIKRVEEMVKNFADDSVSIGTKVRVGKPFIKIIRQVLENGHGLVIKSAEGTAGLKEMSTSLLWERSRGLALPVSSWAIPRRAS